MNPSAGGLRPFRFGMVFTDDADGPRLRELARQLEGEGFSSLLVADHYDNPLACGIVQMAAAAATTTLRVGSYVYDNDFRHPALLAKEVATIDVLSGGRVEVGIGAGWHRGEYEWIGQSFDPGPVRVSRLEESVEVLMGLWAGGTTSFAGEHYRITEMPGTPIPIQRPLPLMIGGGGPRILRLAARRASIVAFVPRSLPDGGLDPVEFGLEPFEQRVAALEAAVAEVGRTEPLERSILVFETYASVDDVRSGDWVRSDLVAASPYALVGDTDAIADALQERRERWGISYVVCYESDVACMLPVARKLAGS